MKQILLLGALFLFGATASAQSTPAASGDKAKTECTKGKSSSCCQGKAASSCCSADSKKKGKKKKADKEQGKNEMPMDRAEAKSEEKGQCTDKKAKVGPAKGSNL